VQKPFVKHLQIANPVIAFLLPEKDTNVTKKLITNFSLLTTEPFLQLAAYPKMINCKRFNPIDLAQWTQGTWTHLPTATIHNFCFDTRLLKANECFLALKTDHNDGHAYVKQAQQLGAAAAIVERKLSCSLPQLIVSNTLQALQYIAFYYRNTLSTEMFAITGSCGKTTAKELLALLLNHEKTFKTPDNFNNQLGVPLSLTQIDPNRHTQAVIEMGISKPHEMEALAKIVRPNTSILLNVGPAHIGNFNDDVTQLIKEKMTLFQFSKNNIFLPDTLLKYLTPPRDCQICTIAQATSQYIPNKSPIYPLCYTAQAMPYGWQLQLYKGTHHYVFTLPFRIGTGQLYTFVSMLHVALKCKIPADILQQRLNRWTPVYQRGEWLHIDNKHYFVDCYNANPLSFADSLQHFQKEVPPHIPRCYILGSMAELGAKSPFYHRQIAQSIRHTSHDVFVLIGDFTDDIKTGLLGQNIQNTQIKVFKTTQEAKVFLTTLPFVYFFLKGSHRYHLETCISIG
jgi:UDP-N-acetylmuramoyl-tripeptide--D-alanyl-D-alanine ligase